MHIKFERPVRFNAQQATARQQFEADQRKLAAIEKKPIAPPKQIRGV